MATATRGKPRSPRPTTKIPSFLTAYQVVAIHGDGRESVLVAAADQCWAEGFAKSYNALSDVTGRRAEIRAFQVPSLAKGAAPRYAVVMLDLDHENTHETSDLGVAREMAAHLTAVTKDLGTRAIVAFLEGGRQ